MFRLVSCFLLLCSVATSQEVVIPGGPINKKVHLILDCSTSMTRDNLLPMGLGFVRSQSEQPIDDYSVKVTCFASGSWEWPFGWVDLPDKNLSDKFLAWLSTQGQSASTTRIGEALQKATQEEGNDISIIIVTDGHIRDSNESLQKLIRESKHPVTLFMLKGNPYIQQRWVKILTGLKTVNGFYNQDPPETSQ